MSSAIDRLAMVMEQLRDPQTGCPWDREQDFMTLAPYTLEEAYEVVEAIEGGQPKLLTEELGDLLFQIAFHAQLGKEQGLFDLDSIATTVTDKMIERHPHVFGERKAHSAADVLRNWEADKATKREQAAKANKKMVSALDGVSSALPATTRAIKLQNRAARVGFDWTNAREILAKIREEADELEAEMNIKNNQDALEDECGDLFFALINLARRLKVDPESALRRTNRKFERRFQAVEIRLSEQGRQIEEASLDEMENLWNAIKSDEKKMKTGS